jgi:hypothetical protein
MPQSDEPRALPPEGEGAPRSIAQRPPDACGRPRYTPSAHGTGRLQPQTASTVEPASRKGCTEATTTGAEDAMTVRRIGAPRLNHRVRECHTRFLEGKPNANHVRARISYSRTQQLHNMDIITQCSNSIKRGK